MRAVFGAQGVAHHATFLQYVVEAWPVRLIALDTLIPGQPGGQLCAERLGWLEAQLAQEPSRPTVLFQHHPPFATGMPVLDSMGLQGTAALGQLIARHLQVERILAGHVHCHVQRALPGP